VTGPGWARITVGCVFTVAQRDQTRERLLAQARGDGVVAAAAITGSEATGDADLWSDIDLAFAITAELPAVMARWTDTIYADFGAVHHWDLPAGPSVYRVFLLPDGLEVDIAFTPAGQFGALGPQWRLVFGADVTLPDPTADGRGAADARGEHIGRGWHHVLHARVCIERGRPWQAEWLISALREHVLSLACLRLGRPSHYARGVDQLPAEVTDPIGESLVRSLDPPELRRALAAAASAFIGEVAQADPVLAERLRPTLTEFAPA
jgi:hypothetical protein